MKTKKQTITAARWKTITDAVEEKNRASCRRIEGWFREIADRLQKEDAQRGK